MTGRSIRRQGYVFRENFEDEAKQRERERQGLNDADEFALDKFSTCVRVSRLAGRAAPRERGRGGLNICVRRLRARPPARPPG
jgi:hypothetical protein